MRLVCPNCSSQYEVDGSLFPEEGREVQCSNCEHIWMQYPVADEAPMRLDAAAAPRPSERLDQDDRAALGRAVETELAAARHDRGPVSDEDMDEDEIVEALRKQIKAEGGVEKGGEAKSAKRDIRKAAETAGMNVDLEEEDPVRKWDLPDRDAQPTGRAGRRDGLAAALHDYEANVAPERRGRGFRNGFLLAVILIGAAAAVYVYQGEIVAAYPPAAPYLAQFDQAVGDARLQVETLYVQYEPMVRAQIEEFTAGIAEATSGDGDGEAATTE